MGIQNASLVIEYGYGYDSLAQEVTESELRQMKTSEDPEAGAASRDSASGVQIKALEEQDRNLKQLLESAVFPRAYITLHHFPEPLAQSESLQQPSNPQATSFVKLWQHFLR